MTNEIDKQALGAQTNFNLISIGQVSLDTIENENGFALDVLGGGGAYVAAIAGTLGVRTGLVSRIGIDFGDEKLKQLVESRVNTRGLRKVAGASTRITLRYLGEHLKDLKILTGVGADISFTDIPSDYFSTQFVHIAPAPYETQLEAQLKMKQLGVRVAFAPHADLNDHSLSSIRRILLNVDILFANEDEVLALSKVRSLGTAIELLHGMGPSTIVATMGSRGALISHSHHSLLIPALESFAVVDHVGAGDAFAAGFLVGLIRSFPLRLCGIMGAAVASCVIQGFGLTRPTHAEINRLLDQNRNFLESKGMPTTIPEQ